MEKKLNSASKAFSQISSKWDIDKKKAAEFSKGAQQPGHLVSDDVKKKLSNVWKAISE